MRTSSDFVKLAEAYGVKAIRVSDKAEVDNAIAEISRSQLWQWRKHGAAITAIQEIEDGLLERLFEEEMDKIKELVGEENFADGKYDEARDLFWDMTVSDEFQEFLTLPAYERLTGNA